MPTTRVDYLSQDRLQLAARLNAPSDPPRGTICLVHGLGEHSQRYQEVIDQLVNHRFAVLAADLRGHGQSAGRQGHIPSYDHLLDDLAIQHQQAKQLVPDTPCLFYGHSFGGNLVLNYLLRRTHDISAAIVTSPLILPTHPPPWWKWWIGRLLNRLMPTWKFSTGVHPQDLSQDGNEVQAYIQDPLVYRRVSARLGLSMLQAGQWLLDNPQPFPCPLLVMHGGQDRITCPDASLKFAQQAGDACLYKLWPGMRHELHHELDRKDPLGFLIHWLSDRYAG